MTTLGYGRWDLRDLYHGLFMYYTCASGSTDVSFLTLNQWSMFVDDCQIADNKSKLLKKYSTQNPHPSTHHQPFVHPCLHLHTIAPPLPGCSYTRVFSLRVI